LGKLLKSNAGELAAEFSVELPMNNLVYPSRLIEQNQEKMFKKAEEQIEFICQFVNQRKKNKPASKAFFNGCMVPLYSVLKYAYLLHLKKTSNEPNDTQLTYYELIPLTDKSICVDANCSGCGTCAAVCPAKNIKMAQNKPVWQHHCEMCLACVEWCPTKAIHHWNIAEGKAYHHPSITLPDMLTQAI
jgi:formate hydrogenlyase subunit 6/NADH:ubiquinone oxidoreductase subunit I